MDAGAVAAQGSLFSDSLLAAQYFTLNLLTHDVFSQNPAHREYGEKLHDAFTARGKASSGWQNFLWKRGVLALVH